MEHSFADKLLLANSHTNSNDGFVVVVCQNWGEFECIVSVFVFVCVWAPIGFAADHSLQYLLAQSVCMFQWAKLEVASAQKQLQLQLQLQMHPNKQQQRPQQHNKAKSPTRFALLWPLRSALFAPLPPPPPLHSVSGPVGGRGRRGHDQPSAQTKACVCVSGSHNRTSAVAAAAGRPAVCTPLQPSPATAYAPCPKPMHSTKANGQTSAQNQCACKRSGQRLEINMRKAMLSRFPVAAESLLLRDPKF